MKTTRAFMVGGAAAAVLTTGWALTPKTADAAAFTVSNDAGGSTLADDDTAAGESEAAGDPELSLDDEGTDDSSPGLGDGQADAPGDAEPGGRGGHGAPPGGSGASGSLDEEDLSAGDSDTTDGTSYTGESVQTRYGAFSVQITVVGGDVTAVTMVDSGDSDHESLQINSYALPQLMQEVLDTQSADVSYISGASYTSQGFAQSVADAFDQAGL